MQNPIWLLTRSKYGERFYDALVDRGLRVTLMDEYARDCEDRPPVEPPAGVEIESQRASDLDHSEVAAFAEPAPIDRIATARVDGEIVGYVFVAINRPVYVKPLETERIFDGAYVWHLFVDPEHRGQWIGTTLVRKAIETACEHGAEQVNALVARDNAPTAQVYAKNGFEPQQRVTYYRLFGLEHRRWREL